MKKNLLFDATWLIMHGLTNYGGRSGIFFVCLNILKQLCDSKKFNIYIYTNKNYQRNIDIFLKQYFSNSELQKIPYSFYERIQLYCKEKCDFLNEKIKFATKKRRKIKKQILKVKILFWKMLKNLLFIKSHTFVKNIDIYFSPILAIPEFIKGTNIRKYQILYDTIPLIFPQFKSEWYDNLVASLNGKNHYFAISESAKNDFLKFVPDLKPENITVTPLACSETFKPEKEKTQKALEKYNLPTDKKYIFSLCTLEPRKNLIRAIRTFIEFIKKNKIDDLVFILGGGHWAEFIGTLEKEIDGLAQYKDKIIKAGYIDDEDLAPLYSGAEWFVYTSQYEGFGLPPLEAMACGCPVITSNNSSLPEVVGDAGQMIDWDSDEQHIAAYEKYYFDKKFKNEMAQKGYERSKQFSWQKCADTMIREMLKED